MLEALGFPALASTSSGFAFTLGRRDGAVTLDEVAAHTAAIAAATDLPLSVDLENGYADEPDGSRPPWSASRGPARPAPSRTSGPTIYPRDQAVERVGRAVEAARGLGFPFVLTARAENHIRRSPDLDDTSRASRPTSRRARTCSTPRDCSPSRRSVRSAGRSRGR